MGFCSKASAGYLKLLNAIVILSSLVIISFAIVVLVRFNHTFESGNGFQNGTVVAPLVGGVFLLIASIIGFVGVRRDNKCLLVVYLVLTANILLIILGSGVALLSYSGYLENVKNNEISQTSKKFEKRIQDFELALFNECCAEVYNLTAPEVCPESTTIESEDICIFDVEAFEDFSEAITGQTCDLLEEIDLVGDPTKNEGLCGDGSAASFVAKITAFIEENVRKIGAVCISLAVISLLALIATCVSFWHEKHTKHHVRSPDAGNSGKANELTGLESDHSLDEGYRRATTEEINAPIVLHTLHLHDETEAEKEEPMVINKDEI